MNAIVLAVVLLFSLPSALASAQGTGTAARVNGTDISYFRLERYFADYLKAEGRSVASIRNPRAYARLRDDALQQLIDKELLWQEAQRRGVTVDDQRVLAELAATKAAFRTPEAFERRLGEAGFDEAGYLDYLRRELVASRMLEELSEPKAVSEEEVRHALEELRPRLERPEQVHARHILLKVSDEPGAAEVRERLLELRRQIADGADFAELARRHSEDGSAAQGGDLGFFTRGTMVAPFEQAAFALRPGETSQPVRTRYGWHLIEVVSHRPPEPLDEDRGLAMARQFLLQQRQRDAREDALRRLRDAGRIEVLGRR
ncbi:peptidylprolyl isomerase [Zestomonas carbonaria]|uniref:peptidylprolyl isomerase n=1 Tax=Zestomonas carbonaria TaxID=2762745 RepID=A0A7U7EPU8_9GAMM|nr:peptidylprolyl isomerase [Pseudomonas carbonaria]CAD5108979.1 Chaperone SurA [Pseudomonas carbonaria]